MKMRPTTSSSLQDLVFRLVTTVAVFLLLAGGAVWLYSAITDRSLGDVLVSLWIPLTVAFVVIIAAAIRGDRQKSNRRRSPSR